MNCGELEPLICDYVDGALDAGHRAEAERHLAECPACAELARDCADAVAFMGRAAEVEPPPELITKILFEAPWSSGKKRPAWRRWAEMIFSPILQPRFAMGMAMTILSLSMLYRFVAPSPLREKDLRPDRIFATLEDRAIRTWGRTVKFYDNLKFVYQIQTTLREWQDQQKEQQPAAAPSGGETDERKLPVRTPAEQNASPEDAQPSNRTGGTP